LGHLLQETPQEVAQVQPRGRTRAATSGFSAVRFSPNITTTFGCSISRLLNGRGWAEAMQMSLGTQGGSLESMAHWELLPPETPREADSARSLGPMGAAIFGCLEAMDSTRRGRLAFSTTYGSSIPQRINGHGG